MERLYNHVADFGMIANDTGFAVAHAHCFRIRERLLRLNKRLTGNRLLRGGIVPGGVGHDLPADLDLVAEVETALADFEEIVALSLASSLVQDRLEGTGMLTTRTARDHGVLGYVARASGLDADVRRDHPFAAYGALSFRVPVFTSGDVKARTMVRVEEARESVRLIRQAVEGMPAAATYLAPIPAFTPAWGMVGVAGRDHCGSWRTRWGHCTGSDHGSVLPQLAAALYALLRTSFPTSRSATSPSTSPLRQRPVGAWGYTRPMAARWWWWGPRLIVVIAFAWGVGSTRSSPRTWR
jgi:hypothetical protein